MSSEAGSRRRFLAQAAALVAIGGGPWPASAAFPSRPVQLVVPGGAGGSGDAVARMIQAGAQASGLPLIVENRAGGGGVNGTQEVRQAQPDGHTLLLASLGSNVLLPLVSPHLKLDTLHDFVPVTKLVAVPGIVLASPDFPAASFADVVRLAREARDPLAYGTPGVGTTSHLIAELLAQEQRFQLLHIPSKTSAQSILDLMANRIPLAVNLVSGVQPHVASGKIKAIAVTSAARSTALPEVPTLQESGVAGFDVLSWYGVFAPARTPADVVSQLQAAFAAAVRVPQTRKRLAEIGADNIASTPAAFAGELNRDFERWSAVVAKAKIRSDSLDFAPRRVGGALRVPFGIAFSSTPFAEIRPCFVRRPACSPSSSPGTRARRSPERGKRSPRPVQAVTLAPRGAKACRLCWAGRVSPCSSRCRTSSPAGVPRR
jgi:tripartite-type tricarboxylate transporter receptor subunit TctC